MKLAVVTDSTAFLPERVRDHQDLFVIPIPVILDGKVYNEDVDIKADEYYKLMKKSKEFPKTSQPTFGETLDLYKNLKEKEYDTIISIHLSSGISGYVTNLNSIKDSVEGLTVIPYDAQITSMPMGHMVEASLDMLDAGKTLDEILTYLDMIRSSTYAYFIVDDLNNLVRGGRLTNGAALIGGLLKIKPVLTFEDGKIVLFEKIRSTKKALRRCEEVIGQRKEEIGRPVKLYIIHGNNLELAKKEKARLEKNYSDITVEIGHFGPVIGTHLGEKALGFAICAE
ncbi:DegV family protein [Tetragenococcus muriaticus PMC-11-5]|uniref:DegV family protein n=1 Tax=Tetragenococcus muriaticus PMC-11-5 TaxID=1302649 RepID=A0A091CD53_9ENTE|nr:DegV family protein [Tetragenococcus muriaticus]KFN91483.1 DegV family protein [Tetragenococcus muriaticus PMC-11-5]